MVVITSARASVHYALDTFGTTPSTIDQPFGLNTSLSSLSISTNRMQLNKLSQVEPTQFAYGAQQGRYSVNFVYGSVNSHKLFGSIYGTDGATPFEYPPTLGQNQAPTTQLGITTQIDMSNPSTGTNHRRILKNGMVNSISISASVGNTANGTMDIIYGKEESTTTPTFVEQTAAGTGEEPYTFAHGTFKVSNGSSLVEFGSIQEADITFTTNGDLLYKLGSSSASQNYRRILDVSGSFRTTFENADLLDFVLNQAKDNGSQSADGVITEASGVAAELFFTNNSKELKIELKGLSFDEHNMSGLEPIEPIFQQLPFKALAAKITATG